MGEYALEGLKESELFSTTHDVSHANIALQLENTLNKMDGEITNYLIDLAATQLYDSDCERHSSLLYFVRDIERIGDHFEIIIELIKFTEANKTVLTEY